MKLKVDKFVSRYSSKPRAPYFGHLRGGSQWEAILGFQLGDGAFILGGGEETNLGVLPDRDLDLLDRLIGIIVYQDVDGNALAVVIHLFV